MSDQHAPDAIGATGHPVAQTPALDELMARGVTFDNAYCAYPMCTPSRASFMTGQLTPAHGVWELGSPLRSELPTWAHVLRRAGYTTSISGRMHFAGPDQLHGFERRVYPELGDLRVPYTYGDWTKPPAPEHVMLEAIRQAGPTRERTRYQRYDEAVLDAAKTELSRLTAQPDEQPWALMVGFGLPHFPYQVSREYFDLYDGLPIPQPRAAPQNRSYDQCIPAMLRECRDWLGLTTDGASPEEVQTARRCYYAMITHLDELVGQLLRHLRELRCDENTWIVYLSDHGDNLGEHGLWSKANFYEDSVRVPFIVAPPRCANAGARCQAPVSLIDWMSTLLELSGERESFETLPGHSLLELLQDPTQTWPKRAVIADYASCGTHVPLRMVRRGRWKACFAPGFAPLLFDLERDPHEWHDLGTEYSLRSVVSELRALAEVDGWNGDACRDEVLLHQRRLKYIHQSETAR